MNSFDLARTIEARSLAVLEPFIAERHGRFVLTDKGALSAFLQREVGDLLFNDRKGRVVSVELKAETRYTGNLFLETWSNRNLEDRAGRAERGAVPGWLLVCRADLLFYHFIEKDILLIFDLLSLQRWAFLSPNKSGNAGRVYDFPEKTQLRYAQRNTTCGRIVPIAVLEEECAVPPVRYAPRATLEAAWPGAEDGVR